MKRCKHEITADKYGETTHDWNGDIIYEALIRECLDCGEQLPLGPSDEGDERVAIEILAALLVNPGGFVSVAHKDHNDQEWTDEYFNFEFREDCVGCQADYLACRIAYHETETR